MKGKIQIFFAIIGSILLGLAVAGIYILLDVNGNEEETNTKEVSKTILYRLKLEDIDYYTYNNDYLFSYNEGNQHVMISLSNYEKGKDGNDCLIISKNKSGNVGITDTSYLCSYKHVDDKMIIDYSVNKFIITYNNYGKETGSYKTQENYELEAKIHGKGYCIVYGIDGKYFEIKNAIYNYLEEDRHSNFAYQTEDGKLIYDQDGKSIRKTIIGDDDENYYYETLDLDDYEIIDKTYVEPETSTTTQTTTTTEKTTTSSAKTTTVTTTKSTITTTSTKKTTAEKTTTTQTTTKQTTTTQTTTTTEKTTVGSNNGYIKKTLDLNISLKNVPDGYVAVAASSNDSKVKVVVEGPEKSINNLKDSDLVAFIDLTGYKEGKHTLKPSIEFKVYDIDIVSVSSVTISVISKNNNFFN